MEEKLKAQSWCLENGYKMYPEPCTSRDWKGMVVREFRVVIKYKGKKKTSRSTYSDKEWPEVIWSQYLWFYNKYGKEERV